MKKLINIFLSLILCVFVAACAKKELEIKIHSETFGDIKNPAIILNAGAGCQLIMWDKVFCQKLADKGYFVIRYDYRDAGLSSQIDYTKAPYNALDLADDAISILKQYNIDKAHFVGFSMGGQVAQYAAAYRSDYVSSIVLMATSLDFKVGLDAFDGVYHEGGLSAPNSEYIKFVLEEMTKPKNSLDERVNFYVKFQNWIDGHSENFDEEFARLQGLENYTRSQSEPYINHSASMKASAQVHSEVHSKIKVPALIIHGEKDPVFGLDHAYDMKAKIENSDLIILDDFGHALQPRYFDKIADLIDNFIRNIK